jgi:hypothetical protein
MLRTIHSRAMIGLALLMLMAASLACNAQIGPGATEVAAITQSVVFIAPQNNSTIIEGAEITLAVSAIDSAPGAAGVSKIEFRVDDNSIGVQTAPTASGQPNFTARQTWKATGVQGHFIVAVASRADGTPVGEDKLTIQVIAATTPTATLTPTSQASATPTTAPASPTTAATTAPPVVQSTAAPTSGQPILEVTSPNLNIRAGPSTDFPIIGAMKAGDTATIIGRNADRRWWYVQRNEARGWSIADTTYSRVVGDTANVPLVASPPTPVPSAPPPTATGAPVSTTGPVADLVIDSVTLNPSTPTVNQTFTAIIVIRNQGTVNAGTSLVTGVFQPGNETSPSAVPEIAAGQTVTINMPVTLKGNGANQTASITVDANKNIDEGPNGEANNVKTITYNVN